MTQLSYFSAIAEPTEEAHAMGKSNETQALVAEENRRKLRGFISNYAADLTIALSKC